MKLQPMRTSVHVFRLIGRLSALSAVLVLLTAFAVASAATGTEAVSEVAIVASVYDGDSSPSPMADACDFSRSTRPSLAPVSATRRAARTALLSSCRSGAAAARARARLDRPIGMGGCFVTSIAGH